jgi:DNA-3-methyladenine glycosylase
MPVINSSSTGTGRLEIGPAFFERNVVEVARDLIGSELYFSGVGGIIVETEAYRHDDPASHSFNGPTQRTLPMFGQAGSSYVYRSYGIHWCFNIVCQSGSAVLVRAIQPLALLDEMSRRRGTHNLRLLCSGPGRLCQALNLVGSLNGHSILQPPFKFTHNKDKVDVIEGTRIGISRGKEKLWRFGLAGSKYLSRPF